METFLKYYKGSTLVTIAALFGGWYLGGWGGLLTVLILSVLETSLSFDNAVLNAKKLDTMNEKGRRWFLTWGILIAVFGMRLIFPIVIVMIIGGMGFFDVINLAMTDSQRYSELLTESHHQVAAFGGAFLMMVFLKFMLDGDKDHHWLGWIERPLAKIGKLDMIQAATTMAALMVVAAFLPDNKQFAFLEAGLIGLIVYIVVDGIGGLLEQYDEEHGEENTKKAAANQTLKAAIPGLLYLEVLDASMSFDGVIGAFAITNDIFIIMLGLGVGAIFVRSITVMLVDTKTLTAFRYLEHGAFWAIGALATIMLISAISHIPEVVTGLIGVGAIVAALTQSIIANRRDRAAGIDTTVPLSEAVAHTPTGERVE